MEVLVVGVLCQRADIEELEVIGTQPVGVGALCEEAELHCVTTIVLELYGEMCNTETRSSYGSGFSQHTGLDEQTGTNDVGTVAVFRIVADGSVALQTVDTCGQTIDSLCNHTVAEGCGMPCLNKVGDGKACFGISVRTVHLATVLTCDGDVPSGRQDTIVRLDRKVGVLKDAELSLGSGIIKINRFSIGKIYARSGSSFSQSLVKLYPRIVDEHGCIVSLHISIIDCLRFGTPCANALGHVIRGFHKLPCHFIALSVLASDPRISPSEGIFLNSIDTQQAILALGLVLFVYVCGFGIVFHISVGIIWFIQCIVEQEIVAVARNQLPMSGATVITVLP